MRYFVTFYKNGVAVVNSFDTEREAKHFAKLVNGTIEKGW